MIYMSVNESVNERTESPERTGSPEITESPERKIVNSLDLDISNGIQIGILYNGNTTIVLKNSISVTQT